MFWKSIPQFILHQSFALKSPLHPLKPIHSPISQHIQGAPFLLQDSFYTVRTQNSLYFHFMS